MDEIILTWLQALSAPALLVAGVIGYQALKTLHKVEIRLIRIETILRIRRHDDVDFTKGD